MAGDFQSRYGGGLVNRILLLSCVFGVGLASLGCSGNVSRGQALYADGYYVEAAEVFERNEKRLDEWPAEKRAAYGLYRSMTLLQLGDVSGAQRWIHYVHFVEGKTPGSLDSSEQVLLAQTEAKVDARLRTEPGPTTGTPGAVAAQSGQAPGKVTGSSTLPSDPSSTGAAAPTSPPPSSGP